MTGFVLQPNNQPDLVDNQSDNNEQHLELNSGARKVKSNKRFFFISSVVCFIKGLMAHDWFCFQPNNQPDLIDNQSDNNEQHHF